MKIVEEKGAVKINGGGFAGSIICVVPSDKLDLFINEMGKYYGENNVKEVHINKNGPLVSKI